MKKFYAPDISDKRLVYAIEYLKNMGYEEVKKSENADFCLLGVGKNACEASELPTVDYVNDEAFAISNAYLTAEAAIAIAVQSADLSLIDSKILITGYGRIGKALHRYLSAFTTDITVCARRDESRSLAEANNARVIDFDRLTEAKGYDFVFNTVNFPVFNNKELSALKRDCVLIELASFPGGVDRHIAQSKGINLIIARGLPGKVSPKTAGRLVAETVYKKAEEGSI